MRKLERGEETQHIFGARVSLSEGTANTQIPTNKWVKDCEQFVEDETPIPIFKHSAFQSSRNYKMIGFMLLTLAEF